MPDSVVLALVVALVLAVGWALEERRLRIAANERTQNTLDALAVAMQPEGDQP